MIAKIILNHRKNIKKGVKILKRDDWFDPFFKPTIPYMINKNGKINHLNENENILEMPLPALNRFNPCIWHTISFVFGKKYLMSQISKLLNSHKGFYYLMHPADFMDFGDLNNKNSTNLERIHIGIEYKLNLINDIFDMFSKSGRKMVTLRELSNHNKNEIIKKKINN